MSTSSAEALLELTQRVAVTLARLERARGLQVGCSPRREVLRIGKTSLQQYLPLPGAAVAGSNRPLLICFALVNRPYILDLQPNRSLIRRLLEAGRSVYLVDWGEADELDRHLELNDYIEMHLGGCVRHLNNIDGADGIDLLGVCQGGVFALCYTALHPREVSRLITLTTPVEFHTQENLLTRWARGLDTDLLAKCGNVPGAVLNGVFLSLAPLRLMQHKYLKLFTSAPDERAVEDFVRMERWIFDSPPQAATALAQFIRWFYQENALARGTLKLGGRKVDLRRIRQPLFNLYALEDHIVPPSASAPLGALVGSRDYQEHAVATGHIGMYVSRAGAQIPARVLSWLAAGDRRG